MGKDVIIACDFSSREAVLSFLDRFNGEARTWSLYSICCSK